MYVDSINGIMSITIDNNLFPFFSDSKALTVEVHGVMHLNNQKYAKTKQKYGTH